MPNCDICKKEIKQPYFFEVNVKIIKHDQQYIGSITYTDSEKKDLFRVMCIHQDCWKQLLHTHKGR